jgi:hypothetical protein
VIEAPNRNGTRVAAADSNAAQLTDRDESQTASLSLALESPTVDNVKPSRFSPLLGVVAVLAGLIGSAAIWYFQRQNLPNRASSLRGEISVTPLTNGTRCRTRPFRRTESTLFIGSCPGINSTFGCSRLDKRFASRSLRATNGRSSGPPFRRTQNMSIFSRKKNRVTNTPVSGFDTRRCAGENLDGGSFAGLIFKRWARDGFRSV